MSIDPFWETMMSKYNKIHCSCLLQQKHTLTHDLRQTHTHTHKHTISTVGNVYMHESIEFEESKLSSMILV